MKTMIITVIFLFINQAYGFILINSSLRYPSCEVTIHLSTLESCDNTGRDFGEVEAAIRYAIDNFWNSVPNSCLTLKLGDRTSVDYGGSVALPSGQIIVFCKDSAFTSSTPGGTGYVTGTGSDAAGYFNINNRSDTNVINYSDERFKYLVAHELGHALNLTHSDDPASIMTYNSAQNWGDLPTSLSEDDEDGIAYMFPHEGELKGLLGSCGSISLINDNNDDDDQGPPIYSFLFSLFFGFLLALLSAARQKILTTYYCI